MSSRLAYTNGHLFELTGKLLQSKPKGEGVVSSEVVDEMMKNISSIPESEKLTLTRIGLMVMAGRVTTMNRSDPNQLDILAKNNLPVFVDLRFPDATGRIRTGRFDVRKLTPNEIARHIPAVPKNKTRSRRDKLISWAKSQIDMGFGDISVEMS